MTEANIFSVDHSSSDVAFGNNALLVSPGFEAWATGPAEGQQHVHSSAEREHKTSVQSLHQQPATLWTTPANVTLVFILLCVNSNKQNTRNPYILNSLSHIYRLMQRLTSLVDEMGELVSAECQRQGAWGLLSEGTGAQLLCPDTGTVLTKGHIFGECTLRDLVCLNISNTYSVLNI